MAENDNPRPIKASSTAKPAVNISTNNAARVMSKDHGRLTTEAASKPASSKHSNSNQKKDK